jgi:Collagen triple helix repeat (20 copies)
MGQSVRRLLRARVWSLCAAAVALAVSANAWGAQATLVADAHVNSALPMVNSGAISNLNVGGGYTALLQFDLSMLPAGTTAAKVSRAVLRLYVNRVNTAGSIALAPVTNAWGEYSVTYITEPTVGGPIGQFAVGQAGTFVAIDVTAQVQVWIASPTTNDGFALTSASANVQFDSKENDQTAHAATLEIELADAGVVGAVGATGATGPAGVMGPQGLVGATGATGAAGAPGSSGGAGAGGLVYQGAYSSTQTYGLGDVVVWQGSSYTSLIVSNHDNTPSLSPLWAVLSAQGPTGSTGAPGVTGSAGPQGLPGNVGPNGLIGSQGPQGIAGQGGAQGIPGAPGLTGLSGPIGPPGVAGPVGITFHGAYSSTANYALADGISYQGSGYVSLVASNHGNTPDQSPQWALFAQAGVAGTTGSAGVAGAVGSMGPAGLQGPIGTAGANGATGPQGPQVANYLGNYQSWANYTLHDAVSWQGSTYVSLVAGNQGDAPDQSPQQWAVLAAQGPQGAAGADGAPGVAGAMGPVGLVGAIGPAGSQGPPVTFRGQWLIGTAYATGDAVAYGGSGYISLLANAGSEPDTSPVDWGVLSASGAAGPPGATGATGMQGTTGSAGATGSAGQQGSAGPVGSAGAPGAMGSTGPAGIWVPRAGLV